VSRAVRNQPVTQAPVGMASLCTPGASLRALTRRPPPAQVPIIQDGDKVVKDSFAIAQYLERTYPDRPSLFGGPGGASTLPIWPASPRFSFYVAAGLSAHASHCWGSYDNNAAQASSGPGRDMQHSCALHQV